MSSHSSTTPLVNTIADLTNAEHVKFVQAFQTKFDHFRATPNPNKKRGSQKSWVCQHVMGEFQMKFGPTSREMLDKVDRYLRNHASDRPQKAPACLATAPPPGTRATTWLHLLANNNKDLIDTGAAALRDVEGVDLPQNHLDHFRRARQDVVSALSEDKVREYQELASATTHFRKAPPTPEVVFSQQSKIASQVSTLIQGHLGWQAGQLGDVICFFAVAYRDRDQNLNTQFSVVSNEPIADKELILPRMMQEFHERVNPSLKGLAESHLPRLEIKGPRLTIDIEEMSPSALRLALLQYFIASWVSSGGSAECRFADTLPWNELETVQGREQVLLGAVDFSSFESIWPTSGMPYDTVCKLARKLVARHDLPLFAHSPPTDTTPAATSSSPEPPEHSATSVETPNSTISPKRRQSRDTHSPELTTQPPLLEPALPLATFLSDQPVFTAILPTGTLTQIHTVLPCPPSPGAAQAFADNVSPESSHDPAHKNSMMANNAVAETEQHHDSGAAAITVSTEVPKKRKKSTQAAPVLSPKRLRTRPPKVIVQKSKSAATTAATKPPAGGRARKTPNK